MSIRPIGLAASLVPGILLSLHSCTLRDVTGVAVGSVEVAPATVKLMEGERVDFTAVVRDEDGNILPAGAVTWSSESPDLVSIAPGGSAEAVAPGQTSVWASLGGVSGRATVTVEPPPRIGVSRSSVFFESQEGAGAPNAETVAISNTGGGTLGELSARAEYPAGAETGWLYVALDGNTAPATLTVSVPARSIKVGSYMATVVVESSEADNSPVTVVVQFVVSQSGRGRLGAIALGPTPTAGTGGGRA